MMDDRPKSATETFERRSEADAIKILGDFGAVGGLETLVGNGDDAAVFRSSSSLVFCVDALVEGQDFRRDWATFSDIGWKLGATNLSDLAAMGARPLMGFLSLGLPDDVSEADLEALRQGLEDVWHPHGQIHIAGGDLSRTTGLSGHLSIWLGKCLPKSPCVDAASRIATSSVCLVSWARLRPGFTS